MPSTPRASPLASRSRDHWQTERARLGRACRKYSSRLQSRTGQSACSKPTGPACVATSITTGKAANAPAQARWRSGAASRNQPPP
ncbi:Uncharacterised protein [Bordetella pertussis]|nr:Uncharacterised protein [Bordetella pertussis]CFP60704.1 Uncharacterised protein [Bordetella pertussis]CPL73093.1 Uncharacterised protein [Bordetella pertussis]CPN64890.1 Uncharacterised protein [Bordetella pertussis]CPP06941.1 Uncharacterised protein [Bordetella pertussis]